MTLLLGVDTGGTFTDFVILSDGTLRIHKVLSTPEDPSAAILQGLTELNLFSVIKAGKARLVHGSTVATNAALENKGAKTVYITNRGFTDILRIGRQARLDLYTLQPAPIYDPVPPQLCVGTGGRMDAKGNLLEALSPGELKNLRIKIQALQPEAIAINLLYSFLDDSQEILIEDALKDLAFVSRSSFVLPEYREYERGIATWLNAWLGPLVQDYIIKLQNEVSPAQVAVMQSSGETIDSTQASKRAANLLLSGPAGGVSAAAFIGKALDISKIITFDMGGTSTDVSLLVGNPIITNSGKLGPYPVAIPMIDIHTIGAGGGSIAYVDEGGSLQVGPASAGASPGPACYGRGGSEATVTDANLLLGKLPEHTSLSNGIMLNPDLATTAIAKLSKILGTSVINTAQGIVEVAEQHMVRALQVISVERGFDPKDFTLMCFGGAGGLHVCALAEALGISNIVLPIHGGVFSAFGMLVAKPGRQLVKTVNKQLFQESRKIQSKALKGIHNKAAAVDKLEINIDREINEYFQTLIENGTRELLAEGLTPQHFHIQKTAALRYLGQSFTLTLPWENTEQSINAFHNAHKNRYGHLFNLPIELVNVIVRISTQATAWNLAELNKVEGQPAPQTENEQHSVYEREQLLAGHRLAGPALIIEQVATSYVAPGWHCQVDCSGHLKLTLEKPKG